MEGLSKDWAITAPLKYFLIACALTVAIRVIHSFLRGISLAAEIDGLSLRKATIISFLGRAPSNYKERTDYFYNSIIGTFELLIYPLLMAVGAWAAIGAWIGLKTLPQWTQWTSNRPVFNLFLIGNLLTLTSAYLCLKPLVEVS